MVSSALETALFKDETRATTTTNLRKNEQVEVTHPPRAVVSTTGSPWCCLFCLSSFLLFSHGRGIFCLYFKLIESQMSGQIGQKPAYIIKEQYPSINQE